MRIFCAEKGFGNKGLKGKGKAVARLGGVLLAGLLFAACQKDVPPVPEPEPDPTPDPVTVEYLRPNTTTAHQMKISQTGQELYQTPPPIPSQSNTSARIPLRPTR